MVEKGTEYSRTQGQLAGREDRGYTGDRIGVRQQWGEEPFPGK